MLANRIERKGRQGLNHVFRLLRVKQELKNDFSTDLLFFAASAMVVGLGALLAWHTRLISRGETSIEQHINEETSRKYAKEGKSYTNPYNFGLKENWRLFLGLSHSKFSFFWRIILPSRHPPFGNGLHYESAVYRLDTVNIEKLQL